MNKKNKLLTRRQFLKNSLALGAGVVGAGALGTSAALGAPAGLLKNRKTRPNSKFQGVQIGVTTYSYRSMPNKSVEGQLKYILDDGINAVELVGNPVEKFAGRPKLENRKKVAEWRANVSMDKFAKIRKMFNNQGVSIYTWKPRKLFDKHATDAELDYAFHVAKILGAAACTTEHPRDDALTKRWGKFAAKHKILIAYHAHTDASPTLWDTALKQSKWNAINLDVGHWVAGGNPSPIPFIKKHHDRIESLHLKDRTTPADGALNLPWGEGDTPIRQVLQLMRGQGYTFPASVELEYKIPKGSNAVKEVGKCVEYCREALER
jgi:sugar phosphate isomerase/epimerase